MSNPDRLVRASHWLTIDIDPIVFCCPLLLILNPNISTKSLNFHSSRIKRFFCCALSKWSQLTDKSLEQVRTDGTTLVAHKIWTVESRLYSLLAKPFKRSRKLLNEVIDSIETRSLSNVERLRRALTQQTIDSIESLTRRRLTHVRQPVRVIRALSKRLRLIALPSNRIFVIVVGWLSRLICFCKSNSNITATAEMIVKQSNLKENGRGKKDFIDFLIAD